MKFGLIKGFQFERIAVATTIAVMVASCGGDSGDAMQAQAPDVDFVEIERAVAFVEKHYPGAIKQVRCVPGWNSNNRKTSCALLL